MMDTPEPVLIWIPLMKDLGMCWYEIKCTPAYELRGILGALNEYEELHSMDGYEDSDISDMAKNRPSIRQSWHAYKAKQAKYNEMIGKQNKKDFSSLKALKN